MKLKVTVNGIPYDIEVEVEEPERKTLGSIVIGGGAGGSAVTATASTPAASANAVGAPLAGSVARILVEEGEEVTDGQVLLVLEAMKMETEITAPGAGKVGRVLVQPGDAVQGGQGLIEFQ